MAGGLCHPVSLAGGAGCGIADAAGGQDHRLRRVASLLPLHAPDDALLNIQPDCPVSDQTDPQRLEPPFQGSADVKGAVADGKHPIAPLCF